MKDEKERVMLAELFRTAITSKELRGFSGRSITDLYIQVDPSIGEVQIYDEAEQILASTTIYKWIDKAAKTKPTAGMKSVMKSVLQGLSAEAFFDHPAFGRPLSVQIQDGEPNEAEELLFIDDDLVRLDDPLLVGLDDDLDEFLGHLLGDSE